MAEAVRMIAFAWPLVFVLLPLPWLMRRLLAPARRPLGAGLRVPFFARLKAASGAAAWRPPRLRLPHLVWLLLVAAAAQPQWRGRIEAIPTSGRDLMLVVDISGSMRAMDFGSGNDPIDRLTVVKQVAGRFLAERQGDRVGLILFGAQPFLRAPLTHDRAAVRALID
jgi:Ca-activated chloride channel family protein